MPSKHLGDWMSKEAEQGDISDFQAIQILARRLPKAELHMHFLGGIGRSFPYPAEADRAASVGDFVSVSDNFDRLRRVAQCPTSPEMFEAAALSILHDYLAFECRHVETFVVPGEIAMSPVPVPEALRAIGRAFDQMKRQFGLTGGLIIDIDRNLSAETAMEVVELAMSVREAGAPVLGIGNEGYFFVPASLIKFAPVNEFAKKQGFHITGHLASLDDVTAGLEMGLDRADHCLELKGRPELIEKYREAGIPTTSAPGAMTFSWPHLMPTLLDHPVEEFRKRGIKTCLGTDVPSFVQSDLVQEYVLAQQAYGWTRREMFEMAMNSLEMAWIDPEGRDSRLAAWRAEGEAMLADPQKGAGLPRAR